MEVMEVVTCQVCIYIYLFFHKNKELCITWVEVCCKFRFHIVVAVKLAVCCLVWRHRCIFSAFPALH